MNNGVSVLPEKGHKGHRSLAAAVTEYLPDVKLTHNPKSYAATSPFLDNFWVADNKPSDQPGTIPIRGLKGVCAS